VKFHSTRGDAREVSLSEAIAAGLAADGGLYVPDSVPRLGVDELAAASVALPATAAQLLAPFFSGDALSSELDAICSEAFTFPAPLRELATSHDHVLELFHGPTAAFKDFGARFLAASMRRLLRDASKSLTILVATSGDTGAAVGAAFSGLPGFRVVILYPDGRVSPRQAHQLGCFGGNVTALRVAGSFDDCQRMVKQAFADNELRAQVPLSSANSISLGRLLPQMAYYAHSALAHWRRRGALLNFVVPTGNLGNAVAGVIARALGFPIGQIVLACNANHVLPDFFDGADYAPQPSVATLANAMDVGSPSNFERLRWFYSDPAALRREFRAFSVGDQEIRATIRHHHERFGDIFCPHTATAVHVLEHLRSTGQVGDWAVVATAHPAKFDSVIEPLIGRPVEVPDALAALLARPAHAEPLAPAYPALRSRLLAD
jgi:threonine synthase